MLASVRPTPKVRISLIFSMLILLVFTDTDFFFIAEMKIEELKRLKKGSLKRKAYSSSADAQKSQRLQMKVTRKWSSRPLFRWG